MDAKAGDKAVIMPIGGQDESRRARRSRRRAPNGADRRIGGLTVSFQMHHVHGAHAERIADAQARAIAALLRWAEETELAGVIQLDTAQVRHEPGDQGRAA
ncbi:MAG: hypothetical protein J2P17_16700 [Mycobacterium sp.]|nr:hypothetical protein [Mycobacterium sp.]